MPSVSAANLASGDSARNALIRCPDWQDHAPAVTLATDAYRRSDRVFKTRTEPVSTNTARTSGATGARADCSHTVVPGDTLSRIAVDRLGDAGRWREILRRNPGIDPRALRPGTELDLSCEGRAVASAETTTPSAEEGGKRAGGMVPAAPTGFLARLFGARRDRSPESANQPQPPDETSTVPEAKRDAPERTEKPAPEAPPPPPVWEAGLGEYLADVLERWGDRAGWTVLIDTTDAWHLAVPVRIEAAFDTAVAELVRGLGHDGSPPRVRLYPNRVLRLGGPL